MGGLLLIIPFYEATSWLRFIALAGFLIVVHNLIWFVRNSEEILYDIFPTKHKREKKPSFKDQVWQHVSVALFGGGLIFLIFQMDTIENMIEEPRFWKSFTLVGFVVGIISLFLLKLSRPTVFQESGRRYAIIFGFVLGFMFISTSSASYLNSLYAAKNVVRSDFIVNDKSSGGARSKAYWIFIEIDNAKKRFKLKRQLWNQINVGDMVVLEIKAGFFDYEYVQKIELSKNKISF
ncbi:hypothetical protein [uncultured Winogradskyella sp.]|uniref:hypothetical protein n=1 Tax=uncultured Winogradskyella sp. TaxID=395353 RepID=UPI0026219C63|nr:hypothetical protein [uncultured Winogradskyella sp.]